VTRRKYLVEPHIPGFVEFERWHGKWVLELGCGIGTDTIQFARVGVRVIAVDLSPTSLEIARKRAASHWEIANAVAFVEGDIERLEDAVKPAVFDLVYSFGVIHHTPDPGRALRRVKKYMGPDSLFKLMLYHRHSWKGLWILVKHGRLSRRRWPEAIARHSEAQTGCPVTHSYTKQEARDLLEQHGFEVLNLRVDHIFPYHIPAYVKGRYVKSWYWRLVPAPIFRWLERHLGWHILIDTRLRR